MSSKLKFYIVRHGKTLLNTLDKVQGWCDSPLTPEGIDVAKSLAAGMRDIRFDAVYTSDLRRTRQTAEIILAEKGQDDLPINEMYGLREACFGSYESDFNKKMWKDASLFLGYTHVEDMYKDVFGGKIANNDVLDAISKIDPMHLAESFEQVESRTQQALRSIAEAEEKDGKNKEILIIAHGMSIICMLYNMGGKKLLKSHLENASVSEVTYADNKFIVESMGDMLYVELGHKIRDKKKC